jgi:hypothetical protein
MKFDQLLCEVCHEPVIDEKSLDKDIQKEIYRPSEHERYNVEIQTGKNIGEFTGIDGNDANIDVEVT